MCLQHRRTTHGVRNLNLSAPMVGASTNAGNVMETTTVGTTPTKTTGHQRAPSRVESAVRTHHMVNLLQPLGPLLVRHPPYLAHSRHGDPPSWLYPTKCCLLSIIGAR